MSEDVFLFVFFTSCVFFKSADFIYNGVITKNKQTSDLRPERAKNAQRADR